MMGMATQSYAASSLNGLIATEDDYVGPVPEAMRAAARSDARCHMITDANGWGRVGGIVYCVLCIAVAHSPCIRGTGDPGMDSSRRTLSEESDTEFDRSRRW